MEQLWYLFAQLVVAAVGGLVAAGAWLAVGGLGEFRRLHARIDRMDTDLDQFSERVTRDQKSRAATKAVEVRQESLTLTQEAQARLNETGPQRVARMPGRAKARVG